MWRRLLLAAVLLLAAGFYHEHYGGGARNWAGNVLFAARARETASSVAEVQRVLGDARALGERVKVVGAGHSWNHIADADGGVHLSIAGLDAFLGVHDTGERDARSGLRVFEVRVQAGMTLRRLYAELALRNLSLETGPSVAEQSIAGALATATHGCSSHQPSLTSLVRAYTFVRADGTIAELTRDDPRLSLVAAHLGAVGVLVEVSLRVVERFSLAVEQSFVPLDEVVHGDFLVRTSTDSDYSKFWIIPHAQHAKVFRATVTKDEAETGLGSWLAREVDVYAFDAVQKVSAWYPSLAPVLIPRSIEFSRVTKPVQRHVVAPHEYFIIPHHIAQHPEAEYSVPGRLCQAATAEILASLRQRRISVPHIIEVRFVAPDKLGELAPNFDDGSDDGDARCHFSLLYALGPGNAQHYLEYVTEFEAVMMRHGGRPHWAKYFSASTRDTLPAIYGDRWRRFWALVDEWDPDHLFENVFLRELRSSPKE